MRFGEYIEATKTGRAIDLDPLRELMSRCEWFSAGRRVLSHLSGVADELEAVAAASRGESSLLHRHSAVYAPAPAPAPSPAPAPAPEQETSPDEIVTKFLMTGGYRIVVDESAAEMDVLTEAALSDEDELVSEELAEIYLSQGLRSEALSIYRKLSLLNTEKSIYFAEIIDRIEKNN